MLVILENTPFPCSIYFAEYYTDFYCKVMDVAFAKQQHLKLLYRF